jgi:hypothetical protein
MKFSEFGADVDIVPEFVSGFRVGDTREVDFEEFFVFFTICGVVQDGVDVVEEVERGK